HAPAFPLTEEDHRNAVAMLHELGFAGDQKPIIIHAGSAQTVLAQAKRWPPESYGKLVIELEREYPGRVVVVEGPDERGVAREILKNPPIVTGGLSVKTLQLTGSLGTAAALFYRAQLYV